MKNIFLNEHTSRNFILSAQSAIIVRDKIFELEQNRKSHDMSMCTFILSGNGMKSLISV